MSLFGNWEQGGVHYFIGTGEQMPIFRVQGEKRQYWGTGNIRIFDFGEKGNKPIYFLGTREQVRPWEVLVNAFIDILFSTKPSFLL